MKKPIYSKTVFSRKPNSRDDSNIRVLVTKTIIKYYHPSNICPPNCILRKSEWSTPAVKHVNTHTYWEM